MMLWKILGKVYSAYPFQLFGDSGQGLSEVLCLPVEQLEDICFPPEAALLLLPPHAGGKLEGEVQHSAAVGEARRPGQHAHQRGSEVPGTQT